jgi:hypothetical protein
MSGARSCGTTPLAASTSRPPRPTTRARRRRRAPGTSPPHDQERSRRAACLASMATGGDSGVAATVPSSSACKRALLSPTNRTSAGAPSTSISVNCARKSVRSACLLAPSGWPEILCSVAPGAPTRNCWLTPPAMNTRSAPLATASTRPGAAATACASPSLASVAWNPYSLKAPHSSAAASGVTPCPSVA